MLKVRFVQQEDKRGVPASPSVHPQLGALGPSDWLRHCYCTSRSLLLLIILFFSSSLWAAPAFRLDSQYVQFNFIRNLDRGPEQYQDFLSWVYGNTIDYSGKINNFFSYHNSENTHDVTFSVDVWPERLNLSNFSDSKVDLSFGSRGTYHFLHYKEWSYEHDFLFEPFIKYTGKANWYAMFSLGAEYKITKVKYFNVKMTELFPSFYLEAKKFFNNGFELYYLCANHDESRYYVFPSPIFRYGLAYNVPEKFKFYVNWQIHCCDMFTSKFYLNGRQLGAGVMVQL